MESLLHHINIQVCGKGKSRGGGGGEGGKLAGVFGLQLDFTITPVGTVIIICLPSVQVEEIQIP